MKNNKGLFCLKKTSGSGGKPNLKIIAETAGNQEPFPPTPATLPPTPLPRATSSAFHVPKAIPQSLSSRPLHLPAWFLRCGETGNGRGRFF
jgi:hypothetical protein